MVKLPTSSHTYLGRHIVGVMLFIVVFVFTILHRAYLVFHEQIGAPYYFTLLIMHSIAISIQGIIYFNFTKILIKKGLIVFFVYGLSKDNILLWKSLVTRKTSFKMNEYQPISS